MRNRRKGFTLVELLVVVLILAILMAIALPLYLSAVADSARKTCRANLQTMANAVQAYRVKNRTPDYSFISGSPANLAGDLQATPVCPDGSAYTFSTTPAPFTVSCATHGAFTPGVSNQ